MKLWQKDFSIDSALETFTVGIDYKLDRQLLISDCMGSVAQARTLEKAGLISKDELRGLELELRNIVQLHSKGEFTILLEDEDCHTAIENHLVAKMGDAGKKIHTGRSRNDQILTTLRLYEKAFLFSLLRTLGSCIQTIVSFADTHKNVPMPGRTHMQTAMPSSVGLWAASLAHGLYDDYQGLSHALKLIDRCPLGSAASYGVPLPLDRAYSAQILGFSAPHVNVLAAQNSRGKLESVILSACEQTCLSLSRFAQDLIIFTLPEIGYFSLPVELTSGSSIMPQKKNPDGLELVRSKSALASSWAQQVASIVRNAPTGYNRDMQDTKEALLRGLSNCRDTVAIMELSFSRLQVNAQRLLAAHTPDIFATDEAYRLVAGGMNFRDAYRQVGTNLDSLQSYDAQALLKTRTGIGMAANLGLEDFLAQFKKEQASLTKLEEIHDKAVRDCLGAGVHLLQVLD